MNPFAAAQPAPITSHRVVAPFDLAGLSTAEVISLAARLLRERGETQALAILRSLDVQEIEIRALLG